MTELVHTKTETLIPRLNTGEPFNVAGHIGAVTHLLKPPVGNHLIFGKREHLKVMFVGGANMRLDYHLNQGEELFYQFKGPLDLKILEHGRPKTIRVEEGQMFCLPPGVPHSPQRYANTVGLVIERERGPEEQDGLLWFVNESLSPMPAAAGDDDRKMDILYERYFHCSDLGTQLKPLIQEYLNSTEHKTRIPGAGVPSPDPAVQIDHEVTVSAPFVLADALRDLTRYPEQSVRTLNLNMDSNSGHYQAYGSSITPGSGEFVVLVLKGPTTLSSSHPDFAGKVPKELFLWSLATAPSVTDTTGAADTTDTGAVAADTAGSKITCAGRCWRMMLGQAMYVDLTCSVDALTVDSTAAGPAGAAGPDDGSRATAEHGILLEVEQSNDAVLLCIFNREYFANPAH